MSAAGNKPNVQDLLKNLRSTDESLRKQGIFNAGEQKVKEAVPDLSKILKEDKDIVNRRNSARALGKIGDKAATSALSEALFDSDYYVKQNAAWSLGKLKDNRAVEPLLRLIKGGGAKVYSMSGADSKVETGAVDDAVKTDGMKYHDVQIKAVAALGEIGDEKAVGALINELSDEDGSVRCAILLSLGKIGSKQAVPKLIEVLNDTIWYVRRDAAVALGEIKDLRAIDALLDKVSDKYQEVAEESAKAIESIGKIGIAKAFLLRPKEPLIQAMIKKNFQVKQVLIDSLKEATNLEEDPIKREKLKAQITKLFP
jgi:HEAT repeat protein